MNSSLLLKKNSQKWTLGVAQRYFSSIDRNAVANVLNQLRSLDTSSICDADKSTLAQDSSHLGLKLMSGNIRPLNNIDSTVAMAGIARTVRVTSKNDFMAVLQGLEEAEADEVLVVNTFSSSRAVAGELFCAEAERKGLSGIVIDGPARDTVHLPKYSVRFYASAISPYSGTIQSAGRMQETITCGGVEVSPGDIVMGDSDGLVVGSLESFQNVLALATTVQDVEEKVRSGITSGTSLTSMTNFEEHLQKRLDDKDSALEFQV